MAKRLALTRRAQYLSVYELGKSLADNMLVIKWIANDQCVTRFGFSVTKEIGKATVRNHVKRLLKENARLLSIKEGCDIVFIARRSIVRAGFHQVKDSMIRLLSRANLLVSNVKSGGS